MCLPVALYQDLPVFADVYALTQKIFVVTQDYPREYKFTLGSDMKRDALVLLRSIYRINKARDKVEHLEGFLCVSVSASNAGVLIT